MYTLLELESKTLRALKEIGDELNVFPSGDKRCRQNWIDTIAGVNPPSLQHEAIGSVAENSPGVEVNSVQDIINTWTLWEKEHCAWLASAKWCVYRGENKRIEAFLPFSKTLRLEGMRSGVEYCQIWEVSECTYDFDGNPLPVCSSPYDQESIEQAAKTTSDIEVEPTPEAPLESKVGRIVYQRPTHEAIGLATETHTGPAESNENTTESDGSTTETNRPRDTRTHLRYQRLETAITSGGSGDAESNITRHRESDRVLVAAGNDQRSWRQALRSHPNELEANTSPGVEIESEEYPRNARRDCPRCVGVQSLYWTRNFCMEEWVIRCLYCNYERLKDPRRAYLVSPPTVYGPEEYPDYKEALRQARAFQAAPPPYTGPGDYCCTWAPIAPPTEVPVENPLNEVPNCSKCFDDGYIEDEFGRLIACCQREPKLSREKTQSAIAPAAKNHLDEESDQNPILTGIAGIALSDRFVARYSPPQPENIRFQSDADGQLSLFDFEVLIEPEPPDRDDFESLDEFPEAIARWDREHPSSVDHFSDLPSSVQDELPSSEDNDVSSEDKPLEVTLDSFCLWAPCPHTWYEPADPSEVMELLRADDSSASDFFIPTFGCSGDRPNSDEPPDTWIFAKLPKPKPPKFPPQASQPQVDRTSRNYPETIPKLFHRIAAGSSIQPARLPPGGDA